MTYEEAVLSANNGDVSAMCALGDYHYSKDEGLDAFEWYSKAADKGYMRGVVLAALNGRLSGYILMTVLREMDKFEDATDVFEKTYKYSLIAAESDEVDDGTRNAIKSHLGEVVYYLAFCYYMKDRLQDARKCLEREANRLDNKGKVLLGICLVEIAQETQNNQLYIELFSRAKGLLEPIDVTDMEEDMLNYTAHLYLSIIYRMGGDLCLPGMVNDVGKAYNCMTRALQKSGIYSDMAKKELAKYKKGLFGGYSYKE